MFVPFIPYLVALATLTALLAMPSALVARGAAGVEVGLVYAALLALGALVGHLPERWAGQRRVFGGGRRRFGLLVVWLWLAALAGLPQALVPHLAWLGGGDEPALAALLLNYWLADALSLHPYGPRAGSASAQLRRLWQSLRLPLPIVLLITLGLALPALSIGGWAPGGGAWLALPWLKLVGGMVGMVAVALVAVPVLIRYCWGLHPVESSPGGEVVRDELRANGVSVARVLGWPDAMMGYATAGVIGLLPPFRFLLLSPTLMGVLAPGELRAVVAHEAGHLKHRHLWYFLAAIFSFILLMQVLILALFWAGLFTGASLPLWALLAVEIGALLLFFRFGIGFVSRHFERQADGNALRRTGPEPFEQAISKLALINGIPPEQDNWHHYGIARRIRYAHLTLADPARLTQHDRKVRHIKLALVALLVVGVLAQAAASSPTATTLLGERYLAQRMESLGEPTRADLDGLRFLASRAFSREDLAAAERYFRMILSVTPEDPQAQNNLAWVLATRPDADRHALREGLALARTAARNSEHAYIWDTLAEIHFRLRHYDKAVSAAHRALRLARSGAGRGDAPLSYYHERLEHFSRYGKGA